MVTIECDNCNVTVSKPQSQVGERNFCSRSCSASFNNKLKPKRLPEGKCKTCGSILSTKWTYCSENCRPKKLPRRTSNPKSVTSWRKRTKIKLVEYKGGSCERCGYNKSVAALQFHHRDPAQKEIRIGGSTKSFESLRTEVDKCDLVCSNCHAEIHEELRGDG